MRSPATDAVAARTPASGSESDRVRRVEARRSMRFRCRRCRADCLDGAARVESSRGFAPASARMRRHERRQHMNDVLSVAFEQVLEAGYRWTSRRRWRCSSCRTIGSRRRSRLRTRCGCGGAARRSRSRGSCRLRQAAARRTATSVRNPDGSTRRAGGAARHPGARTGRPSDGGDRRDRVLSRGRCRWPGRALDGAGRGCCGGDQRRGGDQHRVLARDPHP
jgi:hypothetical protein